MRKLALAGGTPLRSKPWPKWPLVTTESEKLFLEALHSGRWTVSGANTGQLSFEQKVSKLLAEYHEVNYGVATCHGSSALTVALEALGVGPGKEVLVPGLTWVACASSVTGLGARPVLVDINPDTLCIDIESARQAMTNSTAAIMLVHSFGSAADVDAFSVLSEEARVPFIEDCSQSHGAIWGGRRLGSFGAIAAMSFQQTKLLTSGEGGAVLTNDEGTYDKMQQLRADGRRNVETPRKGYLDIEEVGSIQGRNYCMTEFQAALLTEGLRRLDTENKLRRRNVDYLKSRLSDTIGISVQKTPRKLDEAAYYHLCLKVELERYGDFDIDFIAKALVAELGLPAIESVDTPLNSNCLYNPLRSPRTARQGGALLDPSQFKLPNCDHAKKTHLTFPHRALLGTRQDMDCIIAAFEKIRDASSLSSMYDKS